MNLLHTPTALARSRIVLALCVFLLAGSAPSLAQLSGTYTINPVGGNYLTIADAVSALVANGVSAPVTFNIAPATYTGGITIPAITGASNTNTITFNGTNAATCIVEYAPVQYGSVIKLDGADYIRIQNLKINATGASYGYGVHLTNQADYNIISGCNVNVNTTSTNTDNAGIIGCGTTGASTYGNWGNYNIVQNCQIDGGYYGVRFNGTSSSTNTFGNQILNNTITNYYYYGVDLYYSGGATISGNTFQDRPSATSSYGVYLYYSRGGSDIRKNRIVADTYGIYMQYANQDSTNRSEVSNNMIMMTGTSAVYGIYAPNAFMIDVWYNSIDLGTTTGTGYGGYLTGNINTKHDVRNNTVQYRGSGTFYAVYISNLSPLQFLAFDYNNAYFATGIVNYYVNSTAYNGLTFATAYPGWATHSLEADPCYASSSDLHSTSTALNGAGQTIAGVTTDYDGDTRNASTPDIGADEFTPPTLDVAITGITLPSGSCGLTASETISVTLRNNAAVVLNGSVNPVTVNIAVTGANTQNLAAVWNSGTIASQGTTTFTVSNALNLSLEGTYNITATAVMTGDQNTSNNTFGPVQKAADATLASFPYFENFETTNGGWSHGIVSGTTPSTWGWGVPNFTGTNGNALPFTSAHSGSKVWAVGFNQPYNNSEVSALTSPCLNLAGMTNPVMTFWMNINTENNYDALIVEGSTDGGNTWTKLTPAEPAYWSTSTSGPIAPPKYTGYAVTGWNKYKFNLTTLAGLSTARVRFTFGADGSVNTYSGVMIDDISIVNLLKDVEVIAINMPTASCGFTNAETVSVTIRNNGPTALDASVNNIPVALAITGPVAQNFNATLTTGTIATNGTAQLTISTAVNLATAGTYSMTATTSMTGDDDPSNNAFGPENLVSQDAIAVFPYTMDFEASDGAWIASAIGTAANDWAWGVPNYSGSGTINTAHSGTKVWATGLTTAYSANANAVLTSPCVNLTTLNNPVLMFWMNYYSETSYDGLILEASTDGGTTWNKLTPYDPPYNVTTTYGPIPVPYYGGTTNNTWQKYIFDLSSFAHLTCKIRFRYGSDGSVQYAGFAIDDIVIGDFPQKELAVTHVQYNNNADAWARIIGKPHVVEATVENLGYGANPTSFTAVYKQGSNPANEFDGIAETVNPIWNGTTGTFTFTTPHVPAANGIMPFFVRVFYTGDPNAANDYNLTLPNVRNDKTYGYEDFELLTPPEWEKKWLVNDVNGGETWALESGIGNGNTLGATYAGDVTNANDWLITPGAVLGAGASYSVKFKYRSRNGNPQVLEVAWGTSPDPATMTVFATFSNFTNTTFADAIGTEGVAPYFNTPNIAQPYYVGFHVRSAANAGPIDLDDIEMIENPTPPPKIAYGIAPDFVDDPTVPIVFSGVYKKTGLLSRTYTVINNTGKYGNPPGDMLWDVRTSTDWITLIKSTPDPLTFLASNPYNPAWARQYQTFTIEIDPSTLTPGKRYGDITLDAVLYNIDYPNGIRASNAPFTVPVELNIVSTGGEQQPQAATATQSSMTSAGNPWIFMDNESNIFATVWVTSGTIPSMSITTHPGQLPIHLSRFRYVKHYWEVVATGSGWTADIQYHYFDSEVAAGFVQDEHALVGTRIAPNTSFWQYPISATTSAPNAMQNYVTVQNMTNANCGGQIALAHPWFLMPGKSEGTTQPATCTLQQNYPNPFNPSTEIRFGIPEDAHVTLTVMNGLGQEVARLVNETLKAGYHTATFDATGLPSGMYMYTLKSGSFTSTRTMVLGK